MKDLILCEEFLPDIGLIEQHALDSKFIDWLAPDGEVYKRICITEIPGLHNAIERVVGPIEMLGMGYRLNYKGELPNQSIHSDVGWGTHALVLYLRDGDSGTGFWQHRETKAVSIKQDDVELYEKVKDAWDDPSKWTLYNFVGMRKNRAIIYSSELFHSRWPFEGFGDSPENGRLIVVAFFNKGKREMIRSAVTADLPRIMQMCEKFYATTDYKDHAPLDFDSTVFIAKTLIDTGIVLVAELEGNVVGLVGCALAPFIFNTDYLCAHEVVWWVEPDCQDSGIGRALLEGVEMVCENKEITFIRMMLLPTSPPKADALYRVLGYTHSETSYTKVI